jgi:hypothetical protein
MLATVLDGRFKDRPFTNKAKVYACCVEWLCREIESTASSVSNLNHGKKSQNLEFCVILDHCRSYAIDECGTIVPGELR